MILPTNSGKGLVSAHWPQIFKGFSMRQKKVGSNDWTQGMQLFKRSLLDGIHGVALVLILILVLILSHLQASGQLGFRKRLKVSDAALPRSPEFPHQRGVGVQILTDHPTSTFLEAHWGYYMQVICNLVSPRQIPNPQHRETMQTYKLDSWGLNPWPSWCRLAKCPSLDWHPTTWPRT